MQGWTPHSIPELTADAVKPEHHPPDLIAVPGAEAIRCSAELVRKSPLRSDVVFIVVMGLSCSLAYANAHDRKLDPFQNMRPRWKLLRTPSS